MGDISESGFNDCMYALVTGANGGLGFALCCRLIDEFLQLRPKSQSLVLIITTRSKRKGDNTIELLKKRLKNNEGKSRITIRTETVDLSSLISVKALSQRLLSSIPKLDAVFLNAGNPGFTGINWPVAIWSVLTDIPHAVTWPRFKLSRVGYLTQPQFPATETVVAKEPPLGEVFCSNLFGHYMLVHYIMSLLSRHSVDSPGRIIWISSIEAIAPKFSSTDLQGLRAMEAYEHVKRLTDILFISGTLPSTSPWVNRFLTPPSSILEPSTKPRLYVSHPGICATNIVPLHPILIFFMNCAFMLARFLGSPWHTCKAYLGATAPVWLALTPQSTLDAMESEDGAGAGKWGSSTDIWGHERVQRTEVDEWGWGGKIGEKITKVMQSGRRKNAKILTAEDRERFEEVGRLCWENMEQLREEWEERLKGVQKME
ncbi:MAG: 3-keto-steroid reductase [Cirrosporium novae-zelandiae]|nr:MAG: 3-keto-steroid reductase [Cirrosporium novae-zelandiae]